MQTFSSSHQSSCVLDSSVESEIEYPLQILQFLIALEAEFSLMEDPILLEINAEIDLLFDSMSRIAIRDRGGWMLQSFKP
jgi:hypothetical protein